MLLGYYSGYFLSSIFGVVYPVYSSFKSLQKGGAAEQWLPYWILFALFTSIEFVLDLVFSAWMPLWYEAKLAFLLWLQPIRFNGAALLYGKYVEPFLVKQAPFLDEQAAIAMKRVKNINVDDLQKAIDWVSTNGQSLASSVMGGPPPTPMATEPSKPAEAQREKPASPEPEDDTGSEEVVSVDDVSDAGDKKDK